ncbi:MAG: hypothetical protein JO250_16870 [Armatimonadetes bacterium]|nr:hypothetical protein [Armatimonadota bacterium]
MPDSPERPDWKGAVPEVWPPQPSSAPPMPEPPPRLTLRAALLNSFPFTGIIVGLIANALIYRHSLFLLHIPPGTPIRPMMEAVGAAIITLAAFVVGVPLSFGDMRRGWRAAGWVGAACGLVGLLLCLAPLPFNNLLWDYLAARRGLIFEQ